MTMPITSSTSNLLPVQPTMPTMLTIPTASDENMGSQLSDLLTPEQKNTVQNGLDDKLTAQVDNIKANYQTAKDTDLMQAYYQQQQKLFDIYIQTSNGGNATTSTSASQSDASNTRAVSALTNAYVELYQLHKNVKDGISQLPSIAIPENRTQPENTDNNVYNQVGNNVLPTATSSLSHKQLDTYNSLMTPSSSSYMHLSA